MKKKIIYKLSRLRMIGKNISWQILKIIWKKKHYLFKIKDEQLLSKQKYKIQNVLFLPTIVPTYSIKYKIPK